MICDNVTDYLDLTSIERMELINYLQQARLELAKSAKRKRATTTRKKKEVKMQFASEELEAIFNGMPDDCKRLIMKGE